MFFHELLQGAPLDLKVFAYVGNSRALWSELLHRHNNTFVNRRLGNDKWVRISAAIKEFLRFDVLLKMRDSINAGDEFTLSRSGCDKNMGMLRWPLPQIFRSAVGYFASDRQWEARGFDVARVRRVMLRAAMLSLIALGLFRTLEIRQECADSLFQSADGSRRQQTCDRISDGLPG